MNAPFRLFRLALSISQIVVWPVYADIDHESPGSRAEGENRKLLQEVAQGWDRVNRWLIEYDASPMPQNGEFSRIHRIMAVASPGELYHLGAHYISSTWSWEMDPFAQDYFIHDGSTMHRWPFNRMCTPGTLHRGDIIPGSLHREFLLAIVPSWPLMDYKLGHDHPKSVVSITPAEAVRSSQYQLRSTHEQVAGQDCVVLECGDLDRIWLATGMGLCVMRRDLADPGSHKLECRLLSDRVKLVAPNLWLPSEFREQFFASVQSTNEPVIDHEYRFHIIRCLLNEAVPQTTFVAIQKPGSLEYPEHGEFKQTVSGGQEVLSEIVNFIAKGVGLQPQPRVRTRRVKGLVVGVGIGIVLGLLIRRFGNQRGKDENRRRSRLGFALHESDLKR